MKTYRQRDKIVLSAVVYVALYTAIVYASQGLPGDFSRYDMIIKRMPFGSIEVPVVTPPAPATVAQSTAPAADSWIKNYRIIAITESSLGVRVGLANIKSDPVLSFFLFKGETDDDVTLVEADYDAEKALLKRGEEQYWLSMTGVTEGGGPAAPGQRQDLTDVQKLIASRVRQGGSSRGQREPFAVMTKEQYRLGRENGTMPPPVPAMAILRQQDPEELAMSPEERHNRLRAYNMDLIRAGGEAGVPLPIQLTPAEDAQLVAEGVLPPQ